MRIHKPTIVVFAKEPRLGFVKTRLARDMGAMRALSFYRSQLGRTVRRLVDPRWRLMVAVTPDDAVSRVPVIFPMLPTGSLLAGQGAGDLGARMVRALSLALEAGGPAPALLIGADIPALNRAVIARALRNIAGADIVFGPATDGGFWLIGARRQRDLKGLFEGVDWSRQATLRDSLGTVRTGARVAFADRLSDVDTAADLRRLHP